MQKTVTRVAVVLAAFATCFMLSQPPKRPTTRVTSGVVALNPRLLRILWAGYRAAAADFYWVRTIEQIGGASTADEYRDVGVWANLATDLDPKFRLVYQFAAVAMPFNVGRNTWVNGDESTALIKKGLAEFPDNYNLQYLLAHNLIFYSHDYVAAGELLRTMAIKPGAPAFLGPLATRVLAQGGEIDAAIDFARNGVETAQSDETREVFRHRIRQLETERVLQQIDKAVTLFRETEHRLPGGIAELLTQGSLAQMPLDPSGGMIYIDRLGRARSTTEARRLEIITPESKQLEAEGASEVSP